TFTAFITRSRLQLRKTQPNRGCALVDAYLQSQHAVIPSQVFELEDGSSSYKDFAMTRNNRFSSAGQASKNIIQPPSAVLHYYNVPPHVIEQMKCHECGRRLPFNVQSLFSASSKTISGLLEFDSKTEAVEVLTVLNHYQIRIPSKSMRKTSITQVAAIEQNLQVLVADDVPFRSFNLPEWDKHYSQD
uniref:Heterogeneous nuclear ribonucleoprotein L RRM domain-containing protein n=1 Tax=Neolamprologus brichardi TaxID=32507 RepID=A0A3Q4I9N0_NEOBR